MTISFLDLKSRVYCFIMGDRNDDRNLRERLRRLMSGTTLLLRLQE